MVSVTKAEIAGVELLSVHDPSCGGAPARTTRSGEKVNLALKNLVRTPHIHWPRPS